MGEKSSKTIMEVLNAQCEQWEGTFLKRADLFGTQPSDPAQKAAEVFIKEGKTKILELGGGQGRDTIFFAEIFR